MTSTPAERASRLWHGAKSWHDADPPLRGEGVRIGVIDVGFYGFKQLQMPGDVPSFGKVTSGMDVVLAIQQGDVMESVDIHKN